MKPITNLIVNGINYEIKDGPGREATAAIEDELTVIHNNIEDNTNHIDSIENNVIPEKENFRTLAKIDTSEINSIDTFRTYFYNLRKSPSRKWQFEIERGVNENIVIGIGGLPDDVDLSEKGFIYVEIPYSEAGGFQINIEYQGRTNGKLYKKYEFATLDSNWHSTGWLNVKHVEDILNVTIVSDGFGNYTANYNDNDINNFRNAGGLVQAKYDTGTETYTYYYSTMESDRRPSFIRTYIENGITKQVIIKIGYDKKVEIETRISKIKSLETIWNNPNPNIEMAAQEIPISNINNDNFFIIKLKTSNNRDNFIYVFAGKDEVIQTMTNSPGYTIFANRRLKISNESLQLYNSYITSKVDTIDNRYLIPVKIYTWR